MSEAKQPIAIDRRARRDRAWWEQAVAQLEASGMSAAAFAQQEGMGYKRLRALQQALAAWQARLDCFTQQIFSLRRVGRKAWLFAGSIRDGEAAAVAFSLIETAKLNGIEPFAYLKDVLTRIRSHRIDRLAELLPFNLNTNGITAGKTKTTYRRCHSQVTAIARVWDAPRQQPDCRARLRLPRMR